MSCLVEVLTQTTVKLHKYITTVVDDAFVPDFTGLTVTGYISSAQHVQQPLLALGTSAGVTVTSTLIDMAGPPWLFYRGISAGGQDATNKHIFIGNRIIGGRRPQIINADVGSSSAVCHTIYKAGPVTSFAAETGVTKVTSSSGQPRTENLTRLTENTVYDVQIQCDRGVPVYVSFETQ